MKDIFGVYVLPTNEADERVVDELIRRAQERRCICGRDKEAGAVDCSETYEMYHERDEIDGYWDTKWRRTSAGTDRGGEG